MTPHHRIATLCAVLAALAPRPRAAADLPLLTGTYLGGPILDQVSAVEIAPDTTIVVAGTFPGTKFGIRTPIQPFGAGYTSAVLRLDRTGTRLLSMTQMCNELDDMDVHRGNGKIAVVCEYGPALLSADGAMVLWTANVDPSGGSSTTGEGRRISIGSDGTVAVLHGKHISVFGEGGDSIAKWRVNNSWVNDVAVDGANHLVFVASFAQLSKCGYPVQVAALHAYDYHGALRWKNYDFRDTLCADMADTRGDRVAIGRDGFLYFASESAGGNTIFRRDPRNIVLDDPAFRTGDIYSHAYATASNHITFLGKYDPATGRLLDGRMLLSRRQSSDGRTAGNTITPRALAADEHGYIYVGGASAAYIGSDILDDPSAITDTVSAWAWINPVLRHPEGYTTRWIQDTVAFIGTPPQPDSILGTVKLPGSTKTVPLVAQRNKPAGIESRCVKNPFCKARIVKKVAGQFVGPYAGDAYVLQMAPGSGKRILWTTFNGPAPTGGTVHAIATGHGITAAVASGKGNFITTPNALQPARRSPYVPDSTIQSDTLTAQPSDLSIEGYLAVWASLDSTGHTLSVTPGAEHRRRAAFRTPAPRFERLAGGATAVTWDGEEARAFELLDLRGRMLLRGPAAGRRVILPPAASGIHLLRVRLRRGEFSAIVLIAD